MQLLCPEEKIRNRQDNIHYETADMKEIFLIACPVQDFLVTAVYLLTIHMLVLLENYQRRVRSPASVGTISKMHLWATFCSFTEVWGRPCTVALLLDVERTITAMELDGGGEFGSDCTLALIKWGEIWGSCWTCVVLVGEDNKIQHYNPLRTYFMNYHR